ncbi:DUF3373 family protein [Arcobacter sp. FWKO B]|uniref:DUF3373 family protein n=1 Tax=Arcobacter sp. FWKO B TaxID=2593672 RepID=UPI0018A4D9EA|nr:DUF3373 family protein [Arcobacter sp. FWKO B]QOG12135.1 DUF3373 family protein [Arcobacter sp. FWKO B]
MKKSVLSLYAAAALATASFADSGTVNSDILAQLEALKAQIAALEAKMADNTKEIEKVDQKLTRTNKNVSDVKIMAANDNIKWDVDFRTAFDSIHYKHASGRKSSNPDLLTNRLWLGMGYAPDANNLFKGKLAYYKSYGDTANHSQSNVNPGNANFDWVTNENALDSNIRVKEAYWLYMNDTLMGNNVPWTVSVGRRPSTDGLGINLRENMQDNSPLAHTVNVEFDGLSAKFDLDKITGVQGMWWKLCTGRGLTNAKSRFQNDGADYAYDGNETKDINMYGFIFVPWDNGQYSVRTNWARAENMIGYAADGAGDYVKSSGNYQFKSFGDIDMATLMFRADGIGTDINEFLDDTIFFASVAQSKTRPKSSGVSTAGGMLGSMESKTGHSTWIGLNMPDGFTDDGRIGLEWNKGSKYWRSMTYGEDTMAGSKIAARGTAWEVYYTKPLTKALFFNARYTHIKYDYTGSNAFFGDDGAPTAMSVVEANPTPYGDPVKEASDLRLSISYKF